MQQTLPETFTVKNHGEFVSPHDDAEVRRRLAQYLRGDKLKSEFARDFGSQLLAKFRRYGNWFDNQRAWAHYFVYEVENGPKPREANLVSGFEKIVAHLQQCRDRREEGGAGLKNPCVRLELDGVTIALKLAGARSRNAGKVSVAQSHQFGVGDFYGWIDTDGQFDRRSCCGADTLALLQRVAEDPATQISEIGKESGHCCYCWSALTQVQSKIAGCGKTCARNYRAWYPNAAETRDFLQEHPQVIVGATDAERWENSVPAGPLTRDVPVATVPEPTNPYANLTPLEELEAEMDFMRRMEES
jgi:hypothetical protein